MKWQFFLSAVLAIAGCTPEAGPAEADACCAELDAGELTPGSVYRLGSTWTDQAGAQVNLGELRGRVQIVALIFTRCEFACPRILADLQSIDAELRRRHLEDAHFVLVTMDHEYDTPAVLEAYRAKNDLDAGRWRLLHGDPEDILDLAAVLGIKFKKAGGTYSHSNLITVLDANGEILHRQEGLNADTAPTVAAIEKAVAAGG